MPLAAPSDDPYAPVAVVRTRKPAVAREYGLVLAAVGIECELIEDPEGLVVAVEPARSPVLSGGQRGQHQFQGMGPGFIPPNFDRSVVHRVVQAWEEDAFPLARRLAREEGLFVGMSSGAITWVALQIARELGPGRRVVMIAPDSGARYLSTTLFESQTPDPSP